MSSIYMYIVKNIFIFSEFNLGKTNLVKRTDN